jgi:hypothetical protein
LWAARPMALLVQTWGTRTRREVAATSRYEGVEYGSTVDISLVGSIGYISTAFGFR